MCPYSMLVILSVFYSLYPQFYDAKIQKKLEFSKFSEASKWRETPLFDAFRTPIRCKFPFRPMETTFPPIGKPISIHRGPEENFS